MAAPHDPVTILSEIQISKLARVLGVVFVLALVTFVLAIGFSRARAQRELRVSAEGASWSVVTPDTD